MSVSNPAQLASLFITAVNHVHVDAVPATEATADQPATIDQPAQDFATVSLSDGSVHRFISVIETGTDAVTGAPTFRAGLLSDDRQLVEGPVVNESHRGLFHAAGIDLPDMAPPVPAPPAGPTDEQIAQHADAQKAIDELAQLAAGALAPSHPGIAAGIQIADSLLPVVEPLIEKIPTQQHYDRLHSLMDVAATHLPSTFSWVVNEMRVIHADLRKRTTE